MTSSPSSTSTIESDTEAYHTFPTQVNGGPLTTLWTPPPGCLSGLYGFPWVTSSPGRGETLYVGSAPISTFCAPSTATAETEVLYYSPGICPAGYSSACGEIFKVKETLDPSETAVQCCPTGYTCLYSSWCMSAISTPVEVTNIEEETPTPPTFRITPAPSINVMAWPIKIRYKESDFLDSESGSGLSTGAKIGIGIGVPVVVLSVILVVVVFLVRRRRSRREADEGKGEVAASGPVERRYEKPELADTGIDDQGGVENATESAQTGEKKDPTCEVAGGGMHEMPGNIAPQELDAANPVEKRGM